MQPELLQPVVEPTATKILYYIVAILFALVNIAGFWIREWRKHRTWSKNGTALAEIKEGQAEIKTDMKGVSENLGRVKTAMASIKTQQKAQTNTCKSTVERFDKAILAHGDQILDLAKDKKR